MTRFRSVTAASIITIATLGAATSNAAAEQPATSGQTTITPSQLPAVEQASPDRSAHFTLYLNFTLSNGAQVLNLPVRLTDRARRLIADEHGITIPTSIGRRDDAERVFASIIYRFQTGDRLARYLVASDGLRGSALRGESLANETTELWLCWLAAAAEDGLVAAQLDLASMYARGHHVDQSLEHAVSWYRRAADQDEPQAQFLYGVFLELGLGVDERNPQRALVLYRKAARQNYAPALHRLGRLYERGIHVPKDTIVAELLYREAEQYGTSRNAQQPGLSSSISFWRFSAKLS